MQVLLVTGGNSKGEDSIGTYYLDLDSTEVMEENGGSWRLTSPLPSARYGFSGAVLDNNFFVFGE